MKFLLISFLTQLSVQLRRRRTWLLMVLLPALTLGITALVPAREAAAPVQVGVVVPAGDAMGAEYLQRLCLRSGTVVTFLPTDEETARANVAAASFDCAIVLPEDFSQRLEAMDTRRILTLLTGPASVVYPVVQETAAACLTEQLTGQIAREYLLDASIVTRERYEALGESLDTVLPPEQRILIELETLDGSTLEVEALGQRSLNRILSGVLAVLLLVWAMFAAMDQGTWLESPFARRLWGIKPVTAMLLPRIAAGLCPAFLSALAAAMCLGHGAAQVAALIPYLLLLGALSMLCARWRSLWGTFPVLMPFMPFLFLLLSPVLLDVSALHPVLGRISDWMPVTLYLRTLDGAWDAPLILLAAAVLLLLASITADRISKPKEGYVF